MVVRPILLLLSISLFASWQVGEVRAEPDEAVLVGQVVCSQCWFEQDRSRVTYGNEEELSCARRCRTRGIPPALAVRNEDDGSFELLLLEAPPAGSPAWIELTGRWVRASGVVSQEADKQRLRVASLDVLEQNPWPAPAARADAETGGLSWTDLSGHALSLEDLQGRVVVLNFWATWCAPCRKEMPDLVRVQNKYGMLGVQVVGASADPREQSDSVLSFARSKKLNFPIVLGATTDQMQALGLGVMLPGTAVLDREGNVVERFAGVFERAELEAAVERALVGDHHDHSAGEKGDEHVHVARADTQASLVPS